MLRLSLYLQNGKRLCQELLQQDINLNKNKSRIGSMEKVLIDMHGNDGTSIGRSYRDAPEVDNSIRINEKLKIGEFFNIKITKAFDYDVVGERVIHGS